MLLPMASEKRWGEGGRCGVHRVLAFLSFLQGGPLGRKATPLLPCPYSSSPKQLVVHRDNEQVAMILVFVEETKEKKTKGCYYLLPAVFPNVSLRVLFIF